MPDKEISAESVVNKKPKSDGKKSKKNSKHPHGDYKNSTGVYTLVDGKLTDKDGKVVKASEISSKTDRLRKIKTKSK